jgi:hypothetical protein
VILEGRPAGPYPGRSGPDNSSRGRGALAALVVAAAAALMTKAVRQDTVRPGGDTAATRDLIGACERLRGLGVLLADADDAAQEDLLRARGLPERAAVLAEVGYAVVDVPVQTAEAGAEVVRIAAKHARSAGRDSRTAAAAAAVLASAAATAAALIALEALPHHPDGPASPTAVVTARAAVEAARSAAVGLDGVAAWLPLAAWSRQVVSGPCAP